MTEFLILTLGIAMLLLGMLMVFSPGLLERLEGVLNRSVGERAVVSLRAGLPGEQNIEKILNQPVLMKAIYWDQWLRRQPRALGALLLAAAAVCIAMVAG